jgi:hypothetical protein
MADLQSSLTRYDLCRLNFELTLKTVAMLGSILSLVVFRSLSLGGAGNVSRPGQGLCTSIQDWIQSHRDTCGRNGGPGI